MTETDLCPITITTFINPHLFWFFNIKDIEKRDQLQKKLQSIKLVTSKTDEEVVLVKYTDKNIFSEYSRAVVKQVSVQNNERSYICWLLDFGVTVKTANIYQIPKDFINTQPFIKQAALDNIIGLNQALVDTFKYEESSNFSQGTSKLSKEYISSAKQLFFYHTRLINNIHCGDVIIISSDGETCKLSDLLLKTKNVSVNKEKFKSFLSENLNSYSKNIEKFMTGVVFENKTAISKSQYNHHKINNVMQAINNDLEFSNNCMGRGILRKTGKINYDDNFKLSNPNESQISYVKSWLEKSNYALSQNSNKDFSDHESESELTSVINKNKNISKSIQTNSIHSKDAEEYAQSSSNESKYSNEKYRNAVKNNSLSENDVFEDAVELNSKIINDNNSKSSIKSEEKTEIKGSKFLRNKLKLISKAKKASNINDSSETPSMSDNHESKILNTTPDEDDEDDDDDDFVYENKKPAIGCQCNQCLAWNAKDISENTKQNLVFEPKAQIEFEKPPLLFKSDESDVNVKVEIKTRTSATFGKMQQTTKLENFVAAKVLIHGSSIPAPIGNILAAHFDSEVLKSLDRLNFESARQIQSYTWPCLMRRTHMFIVGGSKSGKTMAYIPSIATYVQEKDDRYPNLPNQELGPIVVVLCEGSETCEEIFDLFVTVLKWVKRKPSIALAIAPMDKSRLHQFYNQCDILVATPATLSWLLRARIVNFKRLCHVVIENADIVYDKFLKEMIIILDVVQNMLEHRVCNYSVQMVIVSKSWTVHLEKLLKKLNQTPMVCMVNYLEAALYGRVNFEFLFVKAHHKKSHVVDIIKQSTSHKIVVFCNTDEEIIDVNEYLELNGVGAVVISPNDTKKEIKDYEKSWSNAGCFVIICTDESFMNYLDITDASLVINYSLPRSWTSFSQRFKAIVDNLASPLSEKEQVVHCKSYIFIDQDCDTQFPRLVHLLQRLNKSLPTKFLQFYNNETRKLDLKKIAQKIELCKNIKIFGACSELKCFKRHLLSKELDSNDVLPKRGRIHFKIMYVGEVNTYFVKIIKFFDDNDVEVKYDRPDYNAIEEKLNEEISFDSFAITIVVGNFYAVLHNEKLIRCKVLDIKYENERKKTIKDIIIKMIDYGPQIKVKQYHLFDLPEEYKTIPPQAYTMFLANIKPPYNDNKWSSDCKTKLRKALREVDYDNDESYFVSGVYLLLGREIWVENVHLLEHIDTFKTTVIKLNIKKFLKDHKIIEEDDEHIVKLYNFCKDAGILPEDAVPVLSKKSIKSNFQQVKPNWAFLDTTVDYNEIYLCCVHSPSNFFVRLKKFDDLLQKLEKEVKLAIEKPFYPKNVPILKGYCYIAKDVVEDECRRVLVTEVENDVANCLFVDYGKTSCVNVENLLFIEESFITRLPFQAIQCNLHGITFTDETWFSSATDIVNKYSGNEKSLYLYACNSSESTDKYFSSIYSVILLTYNEYKPVFINQLLIDCGEAVTLDGEPLNLDVKLPKKCIGNKSVSSESEIYCDRTESNNEADDSSSCSSDVIFNPGFFFEKFFGRKSDDVTDVFPNQEMKAISYGNEPPVNMVNKDSNENENENLLEVSNNSKDVTEILPEIPKLIQTTYSTPFVTWYQSEKNIFLNILLPNVNDYVLNLSRGRIFHFQTFQNDKEYQLNFIFFANLRNEFKLTTGLNTKVIFEKVVEAEWPRLESSGSHKYIKYDLSKIKIADEKPKRFLDLNDENDEFYDQNEIVVGSDIDYSDSDLESSDS